MSLRGLESSRWIDSLGGAPARRRRPCFPPPTRPLAKVAGEEGTIRTMNTIRFSLFVALLTSAACAQKDAAAPSGNDPYAPLHAFLGNWTCEVTFAGEKSAATETYESLCNGQFVKTIVHATFGGQPFHGVSIWGYDPSAKQYVNVWVDSMSPTAAWTTGTYDAKAKTWSTVSTHAGAELRGVLVWKDADNFKGTSYLQQDGKEVVHMEITRTRRKAGAPPVSTAIGTATGTVKAQAEKTSVAAVEPAATIADGHRELLKAVGKWDVVMKVPGEDGSVMEMKAKESGSAACHGIWVWSDFHADDFMGAPFDGAGLIGYDPATKQYTSYWVDTMAPYITKLTGTYDGKAKTLVLSGTSRDREGNEMAMQERIHWPDDNTRVASFTFGAGEQAWKMELHYTRSHELPDHKLPTTDRK